MNESTPIDAKFLTDDSLWQQIEPLIPPEPPKQKAGRPRMADRQAMNGIFYVMRTGCHWKAIPRCLGAASTIHDRVQAWRKAGLFAHLWRAGLLMYDQVVGIDWH